MGIMTLFDFETREDGYVTGTCEIDDATLDDISKLCKKLEMAMINFKGRGASGKDEYSLASPIPRLPLTATVAAIRSIMTK